MVLNINDVMQAAQDVVEEFGFDHRNPMDGKVCVYTDEDGNHCIVGQILEFLNLPLPDRDINNVTLFDTLISKDGDQWPEIEYVAKRYLSDLQWSADRPDVTWGQALERTNDYWTSDMMKNQYPVLGMPQNLYAEMLKVKSSLNEG